MKILMTGFDAFSKETLNPSSLAVELVQAPEGVDLVKKTELPTLYSVGGIMKELIEEVQPDAIVCVGQAGGRNAVTPERIAINLMDCSLADNAGKVMTDCPVIPGGENALFSTLPIKAMVKAISDAGIPAMISNTAGTFVCNTLLYETLHYIKENHLPTKAGFIHVPFLPEQAKNHPGCPSMTLQQMVTALEAALEAISREG